MSDSQPQKSLAQHWLFDEDVLRRIVDVAGVTGEDTVLEIGPGPGSLTSWLCQTAKAVVAVEVDEELARELSSRVPDPNLTIIEKDILEMDLISLPTAYKVVANIPYSITSHLLRMLYTSHNPPTTATLVVQKEIAERVTARPGEMSVLAFSIQYFTEPVMLDVVPKELFDPVPRVDSAILQITTREEPYFPADTQRLFRLVKAGFSQRRKKLINALMGGLAIDKTRVVEVLERAGISIESRAQELSLDQWRELYTVALKQDIM